MYLETNRMLTYATRKHMENIMVREKKVSYERPCIYIQYHFYAVFGTGECITEENRLAVTEGWLEGSGETEKELTHSVGLVLFKNRENVLKLIVVMDMQLGGQAECH